MMNDLVDPRVAVLIVWAFFFFAFIVLPSLCLRCVGCCSSYPDGGGTGESEVGSVYNFLSARKRAELDELRGQAIEGCLERFSVELGTEHMATLSESSDEEKETLITKACPDDYIDEEMGSQSDGEYTHIRIPLSGYDRDGVLAREQPCREEENDSKGSPRFSFFRKKVQATDSKETGIDNGTETGEAAGQAITDAIQSDERRNVPVFCAVCLGEYTPSDTISWSSNPECTHVFHQECVARWLDSLGRKALSRGFGRLPDTSNVLEYGLECPCCRQDFVSSVVLVNGGWREESA